MWNTINTLIAHFASAPNSSAFAGRWRGACDDCASCAVVGASGTLLREKHGAQIDAAQVVLRPNWVRTKGYEDHVGTRTSINLFFGHLGAAINPAMSIGARLVPTVLGGWGPLALAGARSYGKFDERIYTDLASEHPIDLTRYQVANGYMGRIGLINSGGAAGQRRCRRLARRAQR